MYVEANEEEDSDEEEDTPDDQKTVKAKEEKNDVCNTQWLTQEKTELPE